MIRPIVKKMIPKNSSYISELKILPNPENIRIEPIKNRK
jgi:hypothetical protein